MDCGGCGGARRSKVARFVDKCPRLRSIFLSAKGAPERRQKEKSTPRPALESRGRGTLRLVEFGFLGFNVQLCGQRCSTGWGKFGPGHPPERRGWMIVGGGEYRIWKGEGSLRKSGVETFEWRLITLVSVAWSLLLSQEIFYQYSNRLGKRTEKKDQRQHPHPCKTKGAAPSQESCP